jgi:hypothetical protein
MNKPVSTTVKVVAGAVIGFALAAGYNALRTPASPAPAPPVAPAAQQPGAAPVVDAAGKQQAREALMALPELKVWSDRIAKNSGGKMHGALVEYDPAPKLVNGKKYWQLSFVENGAVAAHSWDSFLVEVGGSTILVEDFNSDKQLTLEQWRATKKPMERTKAEAES